MNYQTLLWLSCATLLVVQPVYGLATIKPKPQNNPAIVSKRSAGFTLNDAIEQALAESPRLEAFHQAVAAAKGEQSQAGVWQNPEVSYSLENFGGGSAYHLISPRQHNVGVSQIIEVGGKISARRNIASQGLHIALLDEQAAMLDIIRDVTSAYAELVAAEETVHFAREQQALAEDVLKTVSVRVAAAAAPLIQKNRAEVEFFTAKITLDKACRERDIARKKLASIMGAGNFDDQLNGDMFYAIHKPDIEDIDQKLESTPDIVKLNNALLQSKARLDLEQANAVPDPRVHAGVIEIPSAKDQAFVMGVSIPIPVFNANKGNIRKARSEMSRTKMDNRQALIDLRAQLNQEYERMHNAYMQANTLNHDILPAAGEAFRLARVGYELGRFPYIDVLDAQRSLFVARQQHIDALRTFHLTKAQVERLTAAHVKKISTSGVNHE